MTEAERQPDPQIIHDYLLALNAARRTYQRAPTSQHEAAYQRLFDWFKAHHVAITKRGGGFVLITSKHEESHE